MSGELDHVSKSCNNTERSARNASPPRSAIGRVPYAPKPPAAFTKSWNRPRPNPSARFKPISGPPSPLLLALEARCRGSLHRDAKHRADKQGPQPVENTNGDPHRLHLLRGSALVKPDGRVARGGRRRKIRAWPR